MKKLSFILLAVMLITAMFVSCTAEVIDPYDGLAYVTFGGPASKDLSASYEVQSYEDLYWFYTATKADEYGKTGETGENEEIPLAGTAEKPEKGLGGKIGPFSQGKWNFVLTAYNSVDSNKTLVYKGSVDGVMLTKSEVKSVPVSVTPQGKTGTIEFRNAFFKWNEDNGGDAKPTIKITAVGPQTYTLLSGLESPDEKGNVPLKWNNNTLSIDQTYSDIPTGYYKCTVVAWVVAESSPIFEQSFGIRVYGSATTVISGDITEKVDSFVDFEVGQEDLVVFRGSSTMEVLSTPSNASDKFTTIDFGDNLDADKTYSLSVKSTTAAEAAGKFTVSSGSAAIAGIDLTLTDTTTNDSVSSFDSEITITTYIVPGLDKDSIKVLYGDDGKDYLKSYNASTGELVFTTNHFSQYYVVSDAVASIGDIGYAFLQDAIDVAKDGDTVTVLSNIDPVCTFVVENKTITLDLNGKTISNSADLWDARPNDWSLVSVRGTGSLTITGNGTLRAKENDCYAVDVQDEGATLTIENGTFNGNNHAVYVKKGTAYIQGGTYSVQQKYPDVVKADGFVLNLYDVNRADGTAKMMVTGGEFLNFNPQDCWAEGAHTNFLPEEGGYGVTYDSDNKVFVVEKFEEEKVSNYASLVNALNSGKLAVLQNDISLSDSVIIEDGRAALNLNGKKISIIVDKPALIAKGSSLVIYGDDESEVEATGTVVSAIKNGSVIINGGKFSSTLYNHGAICAGDGSNASDVTIGTVIINRAKVEAQEAALVALYNSLLIVNDGSFTTKDNFVVGSNGNSYLSSGSYQILINGGGVQR